MIVQIGDTIMSFRITGLPAEPFAEFFRLSDEALKARGAVRKIADAGSPCRISLTDAEPGAEVLLVNYEHHPVGSPYRMRFAIFVRQGEEQFDAVDEVPQQFRKRMLAVRAFDANAMMVGHELIDGQQVEQAIERLLDDPVAAYLHVHYASAGCYAARVVRA
jgi:Protein of unknown function (DUF1203)